MYAVLYYLRIAWAAIYMTVGAVVIGIGAVVLVGWLLVMAGVDWVRRTT